MEVRTRRSASVFFVALRRSFSPPTTCLKEGGAPLTPRLPVLIALVGPDGQQRAGENIELKSIGPGRHNQFAELRDFLRS